MSSTYIRLPVEGGGGSGVSSLNGQTGAVSLIAGTNITITPGAGTLTISDSGSGFTFPILAPDGSAGSPSYGFASDIAQDTGMYHPGDGIIAFSTNGVNGMVLTGPDLAVTDNITVGNGLIMPANLANSFAVFDGTKQLISYPGWSTTSENGISVSETVDEINANFNSTNLNVVPSAPSTGNTRIGLNFAMGLDPFNTGFQMGDNTGNGGANLVNIYGNHEASGQVGQFTLVNTFSNLGDGTLAGKMARHTGLSTGTDIKNAYTLDNYQGVACFPNFEAGSTVGQSEAFIYNGQFDGNVIGEAIAVSLFQSVGASATVADYEGIVNSGDGNITGTVTSYVGNNTYFNNVNSSDYKGYQFASNNVISTNAQLLNLVLSSSTVTNMSGINVDISGVNSPNQKIGIAIIDGALQANDSNFDTSVLPASPGFFSLNGIGGEYHVASGHPTSNTAVIGTGMTTNALFEDDMGPDAFGGFLGFTNILAASETTVAIGKTVDNFNSLLVGASVPGGVIPTDGGTITNMSNILAVGCISQGGTITVTNLYGFRSISGFSSLATNAWGIFVDDANTENFLSKSLAIGTVSKKVTNSDVALEIGSTKAFITGSMTTAQRNALVALEGMMIHNTDTLSIEYYLNGTWVSGAGAGAFGLPLSSPITLLDNQPTPVTAFSYSTASTNFSTLNYSIIRNGQTQVGRLLIANTASVASLADDNTYTASSGIVFSATISGGNVLVQYTSTNTGFNGTMKYTGQQWI